MSAQNTMPKGAGKHKVLYGILAIQLAIITWVAVNPVTKHRVASWGPFPSKYLFGIDVSHYQGVIDWQDMLDSRQPINYVFMRATMGTNGRDRQFRRNWRKTGQHEYLRGAYHYYRPNENSTRQFNNYKSVVRLKSGDFVPILDVEQESKYGRDHLRKGVLNWLQLAEAEYGVKPVVYTGLNFYKHVLQGHIDGYPLWIAAYSGKHRLRGVDWQFHQFSEKVRIRGIKGHVDGNDFIGSKEALMEMCMP